MLKLVRVTVRFQHDVNHLPQEHSGPTGYVDARTMHTRLAGPFSVVRCRSGLGIEMRFVLRWHHWLWWLS